MRLLTIVFPARSSLAPCVLFLLCMFVVFALTAMANPVAIQDASFDNRSLSTGASSTTLTPWQETGGVGNSGGYIQRVTGFAADGQNHLGMNLNHNIWQDLGVTYLANMRYTLSVAIGNRSSTFTTTSNQSRYLLAASDGTVFATGTLNASTIPVGTFADAPALVIETGTRSAAIGKTIRILLEARGSGRSHFDNVRLTAVPKQAQTITFAELEPVAMGDPPVTLTATASSGLPVTFLSSNLSIASVSGSTLSIHASGTVTITARQTGGSDYLPAADVTRVLEVYRADRTPQTIVFPEPGQITHGVGPQELSASSDSGLSVSFTSSDPAVATIQSGTLVTHQPGVVNITAVQQGNATYLPAAPVTRSVTVNPGSLTMEFAISRTADLGSEPFILEIPVTARSGGSLDWTAAPGLTAPWIRVLDTEGHTPGILRVEINPHPAMPGEQTATLEVRESDSLFPIRITFTGTVSGPYDIHVVKSPDDAFQTVANPSPGGRKVFLSLDFAPVPGLVLTVLRNTGPGFIEGNYVNLAHGQIIELYHDGKAHRFVANYFGGQGRDLVLQPADVRMLAWGANSSGQTGTRIDGINTLPSPVVAQGALAGKTVLAIATGAYHSLALCADGSIAAWGMNSYGQLGNGQIASKVEVPVEVDRSGVLAGKTVAAIAAGEYHSAALCSDGSVVTWGNNSSKQLGLASSLPSINSTLPVEVDRTGVLAGKKVASISAGARHTLALCTDGLLVAWGSNQSGELGRGNTTTATGPVAVNQAGTLAGKRVVSITAGTSFNVVLCEDGHLASWGNNFSGQLGRGSTSQATSPVAVDRSAVLSGKTVSRILAGGYHTLALTQDGMIAGWGSNRDSQLGGEPIDAVTSPRLIPLSGALTGRTIRRLQASVNGSMAIDDAGRAATWGAGSWGELGDGGFATRAQPFAVTAADEFAEMRIFAEAAGSIGNHRIVLAHTASAPDLGVPVARMISDSGATLECEVENLPVETRIWFEYGPTGSFRYEAPAVLGTPDVNGKALAIASIAGLQAGAAYQIRLVTEGAAGITVSSSEAFTTRAVAGLGGLSLSVGTLAPEVTPDARSFAAVVAADTTSLKIVATAASAGASISLNALPVPASGGLPMQLAPGTNSFTLTVTSADTEVREDYSLVIVRLIEPQIVRSTEPLFSLPAVRLAGPPIGLDLELGEVPLTGSDLTIIENTGLEPITGTFENLPQGAVIALEHGGVTANYAVNYFGGTGNDLVLHWAEQRLIWWGKTSTGYGTNQPVPSNFDPKGLLANRTVTGISSSSDHTLLVCADGSVAAWGNNQHGRLGDGTFTNRSTPIWVDRGGVLANKRVVAVAAGSDHSLALCSDGTLAAWGRNHNGQLSSGPGIAVFPIMVDHSGALAGKFVTAVGAGSSHSLALCSDGSLISWGWNYYSQLGSDYPGGPVPTAVDATGELAGRRVASIQSGQTHTFALCTDGTLVGWGYNTSNSPLGLGGSADTKKPVRLDRSGALFGRAVTRLASSGSLGSVLCDDGNLITWGGYSESTPDMGSRVPVVVDLGNGYSGSGVIGLAGSSGHRGILMDNGTLLTWGSNHYGHLGDGTLVNRSQPGPATSVASEIRPGERLVRVEGGASALNFIGIVAMPPKPASETLAATDLRDDRATLNARIFPNNNDNVKVSFELWMASGPVRRIDAAPATVSGAGHVNVSVLADGLLPDTQYRFRVVTEGLHGTIDAEEQSFTTTGTATLSGFSLSRGEVFEDFDQKAFLYHATVTSGVDSITLTPVASVSDATITVNDQPVVSGASSPVLALIPGTNPIRIVVSSVGDTSILTYQVLVTRLPERFVLTNAADAPLSVAAIDMEGASVTLELAFGPTPGDILTLIENTGPHPIQGSFDNLVQGEMVSLTHEGISYSFLVDYHGGSGNDLVLTWARSRLMAWGENSGGQLGISSKMDSSVAVPIVPGSIGSRPILKFAAGGSRSLVLCADGSLHQWGVKTSGNLANSVWIESTTPIEVDRSGILAGKRVVSIAAGGEHSLVRCSDGTLVAWGVNTKSQLGNTNASHYGETNPVPVKQTGILADKTVVAMAAGSNFNLVLCSDGTLVSWGSNEEGELGHGTIGDSFSRTAEPTAVVQNGVLAGKAVTAISAGASHCLALCSDGTLVTWGSNSVGQLGDGTKTRVGKPVLVDQSGVLDGKTVIAIATGYYHSLVLCSDGTIAAWGSGFAGRLGHGTNQDSLIPVAVDVTGALAGKRITALHGGNSHSMALAGDGATLAWGSNSSGQLGIGSTTNSNVPVMVDTGMLAIGERFMDLSGDGDHTLALVAMPPAPKPLTLAADALADTAATLNGRVNAAGTPSYVTFEYGLTQDYGGTIAAIPAAVSGAAATNVSVRLDSLMPGTTYHYRVVASGPAETVVGNNMTFTTTGLARLSGLELVGTTFTPEFDPNLLNYIATVPHATHNLVLIATAEFATTLVRVNDAIVGSGQPSLTIPLATGSNELNVMTEAVDGVNAINYTIHVVRLPERFRFANANDVPMVLDDFLAAGPAPEFELAFAPPPGTDLTLVKNLGLRPIQGSFSDLAHGRVVAIDYGGVTYPFVMDYFGGSGRDLVLRWGGARLMSWGGNTYGQIGNNTTTNSLMPTPVTISAVPDFGIPLAARTGSTHRIAVGSNGLLAAWGRNHYSQVDGISTWGDKQLPIAVGQSGALAGRRVVAVAAGAVHSICLDDNGRVYAWGSNQSGQLGTSGPSSGIGPVPVDVSGVLSKRRVVHLTAGSQHNLALCDDGSLVSWGGGDFGQLGTGINGSSVVPLLVRRDGPLSGRKVVSLAAGTGHSLALCDDGTVIAWGNNANGQLGLGNNQNAASPVAVTGGELADRKVVAIAAGESHSLALCDDGVLVGWGRNNYGQLGANPDPITVPVIITRSGALAEKSIVSITAFGTASYAMLVDGSIAAWGRNYDGRLGNNSTTDSNVPVRVHEGAFLPGEKFGRLLDGALALTGLPPVVLTPSPVDGVSVVGTSHTLSWSEEPLAAKYHVFFGTDPTAVAGADTTSLEFLGVSQSPAWSGPMPALEFDKQYFWRVDTVFDRGLRRGATWSFRIAPIEMATSVNHVIIKGMAVATLEIPITSTMATPQPWAVSGSSVPSWLTLVTASGTTPQPLQLRFTPGSLAAGPYQTVLRVVSGAAAFDLPVAFRIVEIDITKLKAHPTRPVVYGINSAASGEPFARLVEIDATTGTMMRTMPIGSGPTDLALDPVSERLYVPTMTNWAHTGARVVDLTKWTELPSLMLEPAAYKLEATSTGRLISEGSNQWVTADLYDAANGAKLATLGSVRAGDCEVDPTGRFYYHCDANSSGARIRKYDISNDTFESVINSPILAYGSYNLILSGDGNRLFWQGFSFASDDLHAIAKLPGEVYATNHSGDLAVGSNALWWADSGTQAAALPFVSSVVAISANDTHLVRYQSSTKTIVSTPLASLTDLPGPWPRPGQELTTSPQRLSWSPVTGATAYRVFIGANAAALQGMAAPTATVTEPFYDLPVPLAAGGFHAWRVDVVDSSGTSTGSVRTFGIRFAEGPAVPVIASSSSPATGNAVSLSDRRMLVGISGMAQLLDFDPATGASALGQPLTTLKGGEEVLALDGDKAVFGSASYDSTLDNIGAAFVYRPVPAGYWEQSSPLLLPTPVAGDQFGSSVAASGNLLLAGIGEFNGRIGRVGAFVTEPSATRVQTFSAADGVAGDSFGYGIVIEGNHAIIAAPGRGSSYNRVGCLYAFSRSTSTGQWSQTQKIAIPGATTSGGSGKALALSGDLLATINDAGAVIIFTRNPSGQWQQTSLIPRASVTGSSTSFGADLALAGDLLFIGDRSGMYQGYGGGAVFVFRRSGSNWLPLPTITPASSSPIATYTNFGRALAVRDGWLAVGGGTSRQVWMIRIDSFANRTPRFLAGVPSQGVIGRALSAAIRADDADGTDSLTIDLLQGPSWLELTDNGNGDATLTGTPAGNSGDVSEIQLRVRDGDGAEVLYALRFTLLAPSDLPVLTSEPVDTATSVGRELVLTADASGVGPFHWQWYYAGEPLKNATQATLAFDEITMQDAGRYQVRATNTAGEDFSAEFNITVNPATRHGGDWPTFGGSPAHSGRHAAALDATWFVSSWSEAVAADGRLVNRAAIVGNRAFVVPQASRNAASDVKALNLSTGATLWSTRVVASYSYTPPTVFNDRVYFQRVNNSGANQLFSLNAETGAQVWASSFGAQWDSYEAPAVSDLGIFMNGGTYGGMYGFNFDGSTRFFLRLSQNDGWTPAIHHGRLFSFVGGGFTEHDPANGASLWSLPNNGGTAVIAAQGDSAIVVSGNTLNCFDLRTRSLRWKSSATFSGRPAIGDGRVFAILGDKVVSHALADGAPSISYQAESGLIGQPIVFNDRLVISSETTTWIFNLEDGLLLQTLNAGGRLSYSNGYLLAAGNDGVLRAFAALNYNPKLASLELSSGEFLPEFDSLTTRYIATVPFDTQSVTITPTTEYPDASLAINGVSEANGYASRSIALQVGENEIHTLVTAEDGITTMTYTIGVTRLPRDFVFDSADDIPLTANGFLTGDFPVNIILNHAPVPGTLLTMVNNTGLGFIDGRFANLAHGQQITLSYDGANYAFVANYYGGTGNDLVLQWAGTRVAAWGLNNYGQLGDGGNTQRLSPIAIDDSDVLADKTIFAVSTGYLHSVALSSDGTLASWGYNVQGQLGNNAIANSSAPVSVDTSGVLSDKLVVAIASGSYHNLALCSDGTVAAWGFNNHGQLGDGTKTTARAPVLVNMDGALAGKQVVAIAAGAYQSYALCSDGTIAAWGYNDEGELGNGGNITSLVPVAVDVSGALAGREVAAISAGQYHSLALCTDGTVVSWGYNQRGQLGNSSTTDSASPVDIGSFGALPGKSVKAIAAGASHSLVPCSDGTLAVWGFNSQSQLGVTGINQSTTPVAVAHPVRPIAALAAGAHHNLLHFTDGGMAAWGGNSSGQLGSNNTQTSAAPVNVDTSALDHGGYIMFAASGCASSHNLAVFAVPVDVPAGLVEPSGLEAWSLEHFADIGVDHPLAADHADFDGDGIPNLVEYAFGLDPRAHCDGVLPAPHRIGDRFEVRFSRAQTAADIEYSAEWSPDLQPGSWRDVPDSGNGIEHLFSMPMDTAPSMFMRLRVRSNMPQ